MRDQLWLSSWAKVDDQCPIRFQINDGEGSVDLIIGDHQHGAELILTPTALERLLALGADALEQARDTLRVREGK